MIHVVLIMLGLVSVAASQPLTLSRISTELSRESTVPGLAQVAESRNTMLKTEAYSVNLGDSTGIPISDGPSPEGVPRDSSPVETSSLRQDRTPVKEEEKASSRSLGYLSDLGYEVGQRIPYYPSLRLEVAFSWIAGSFDDVSRTLESYYDNEPELSRLNLTTSNVPSQRFGMEIGVLLRLSPAFAAGIKRHVGLLPGSSSVEFKMKLSTVEARYRPFRGSVSPEFTVGYGWQDVRVKQSYDVHVADLYELESVTWHGKATGLVLGLGLDSGPETGAGLILGVRFMPFPSIPSELATEVTYPIDLGSTVPRDTTMSMWVVTCGLRFNY